MGRAQEGTDETQRGVAELGPVDCVRCGGSSAAEAAAEAGQQCVNGHINITPRESTVRVN